MVASNRIKLCADDVVYERLRLRALDPEKFNGYQRDLNIKSV